MSRGSLVTDNDSPIERRELKSELRAFRWEMRALIAPLYVLALGGSGIGGLIAVFHFLL